MSVLSFVAARFLDAPPFPCTKCRTSSPIVRRGLTRGYILQGWLKCTNDNYLERILFPSASPVDDNNPDILCFRPCSSIRNEGNSFHYMCNVYSYYVRVRWTIKLRLYSCVTYAHQTKIFLLVRRKTSN